MEYCTNWEILKRLEDVKPLITKFDADKISIDVLFSLTDLTYNAFEEYLKYDNSSPLNADFYKAFDYLHSIKAILLNRE